MRRPLLCLLFVWLLCQPAFSGTRRKADIVYLKNGDRITCEIKKLEYGQLQVKAPYTNGVFSINWEQVERVESPQGFTLEMQSGVYYTGEIKTDKTKDENIEVKSGLSEVKLPQREIVRIGQYGAGLKDRIKFAIDYGFSFARSNSQTQSSLHSSVDYRTDKKWIGGVVDSLFTSQKDAENTNRHQGSLYGYRRISGSRWYGGVTANFLTNNSQDLALRATGGVGVLRNFLTTNRSYLVGEAGVVYTNEKYTVPAPEGQRFSSGEASVGISYSTFRFDTSEFKVKFVAYPSLTQGGRIRTSNNVDWYMKIWGDLYSRVGIYGNFDSRPPASTAKYDYGITSSIGWSF